MKTVMSGINKVYDGFNKINEWFIILLMAAHVPGSAGAGGVPLCVQLSVDLVGGAGPLYFCVDGTFGVCMVRERPSSCKHDRCYEQIAFTGEQSADNSHKRYLCNYLLYSVPSRMFYFYGAEQIESGHVGRESGNRIYCGSCRHYIDGCSVDNRCAVRIV